MTAAYIRIGGGLGVPPVCTSGQTRDTGPMRPGHLVRNVCPVRKEPCGAHLGVPADYQGGLMTTIATRIPVLLIAADPILRNGLRTTLYSRPEIRVVDEDDSSPDTVVIVATDRIDEQTKQTLRSLQCRRMAKVVLIAGDLDDSDVMAAVENGVCAVARRA